MTPLKKRNSIFYCIYNPRAKAWIRLKRAGLPQLNEVNRNSFIFSLAPRTHKNPLRFKCLPHSMPAIFNLASSLGVIILGLITCALRPALGLLFFFFLLSNSSRSKNHAGRDGSRAVWPIGKPHFFFWSEWEFWVNGNLSESTREKWKRGGKSEIGIFCAFTGGSFFTWLVFFARLVFFVRLLAVPFLNDWYF